jgi:hypothetical protein
LTRRQSQPVAASTAGRMCSPAHREDWPHPLHIHSFLALRV